MNDYGRRLVIDADFETAVGAICRAIREEGLQVVGRIDVRDHFWRHVGHDFRQYLLIEAWSPDLVLEALRLNLDLGTVLSTTFAIYELADGKTVVVAKEPLSPAADQPGFREDFPALAVIADRERERIVRVIGRLQPRGSQHAAISPAA